MTSAVALRDLGEAAWTAHDLFPPSIARPDRRNLAESVRLLRDVDGLTIRTIAAHLGISRSYASSLYHDPTGDGDRERKKRYCGKCVDCDGPTCGGDGREKAPERCAKCAIAKQHDDRFWTREQILEGIRVAGEILGRQATVTDFMPSPSIRAHFSPERWAEIEILHAAALLRGIRLPAASCIAREFGGFTEALAALGLEPTPTGHPSHRIPGRHGKRGIIRLPEGGALTEVEESAEEPPKPLSVADRFAFARETLSLQAPHPRDREFIALVERELDSARARALLVLADALGSEPEE